MWNKLYIIIDQKNIKRDMIFGYDGKDVFVASIAFLIGYLPLNAFGQLLTGFITGVVLFILMAFLLYEMDNGLSVLDHIKMWYKYTFKNVKAYYYVPKGDVVKPQTEEVDVEKMEFEEFQKVIFDNRFGKKEKE